MIKKPEKTRNLQNTDSERIFFSPNIWHVNIASLQFYKQMYNNASHICDGEESSSAFFFLLFSSPRWPSLFYLFFFMRSTRTPLHCGGQNLSSPCSLCLLFDGWRCPCCWLWNFCAQKLGRKKKVAEIEK